MYESYMCASMCERGRLPKVNLTSSLRFGLAWLSEVQGRVDRTRMV